MLLRCNYIINTILELKIALIVIIILNQLSIFLVKRRSLVNSSTYVTSKNANIIFTRKIVERIGKRIASHTS